MQVPYFSGSCLLVVNTYSVLALCKASINYLFILERLYFQKYWTGTDEIYMKRNAYSPSFCCVLHVAPPPLQQSLVEFKERISAAVQTTDRTALRNVWNEQDCCMSRHVWPYGHVLNVCRGCINKANLCFFLYIFHVCACNSFESIAFSNDWTNYTGTVFLIMYQSCPTLMPFSGSWKLCAQCDEWHRPSVWIPHFYSLI